MIKYFKSSKIPTFDVLLKVEDFQFYVWYDSDQGWIPIPEPPTDCLKEITEEEAFLEILCEE